MPLLATFSASLLSLERRRGGRPAWRKRRGGRDAFVGVCVNQGGAGTGAELGALEDEAGLGPQSLVPAGAVAEEIPKPSLPTGFWSSPG